MLARRNTARLLAAGGVEAGSAHYPVIVAVHALWIAAIFYSVPPDADVNWLLLLIFLLLQAGRVWVIASLGRYWTTRIITIPGQPLVKRGPYRLLRHPNYVIVTAEIACLPLAFGAWQIAVYFTVANCLILGWRIRTEDRVLASRR